MMITYNVNILESAVSQTHRIIYYLKVDCIELSRHRVVARGGPGVPVTSPFVSLF